MPNKYVFLSTLSLRRATRHNAQQRRSQRYFYPRSPCGERQGLGLIAAGLYRISIHALLAESDSAGGAATSANKVFLSTLSLRRATRLILGFFGLSADFYPRSPCGERRICGSAKLVNAGFLSTLSLRRATIFLQVQPPVILFLSTLSLRRATYTV